MNCHHNSIDFPDRELWTDHIGSEHGLAPDWPNQECPLCLKETGSGKDSVVAHLTTHMEDISLAALPPLEANSENIYFNTSSLSQQHPCTLINKVLSAAHGLYSPPLREILTALGMQQESRLAVIEGLQVINLLLGAPDAFNSYIIIRLLFLAKTIALALGEDFGRAQEEIYLDGRRLILQLPSKHERGPLHYQVRALCGRPKTQWTQLEDIMGVPGPIDPENSFSFQTCAVLLTRKYPLST